eukprot:jgi/Botrbrau1/16306/Bobra.0066s0074.1
MLKYDITTVGLNLGTAEEFSRKTGFPLPRGRESAQGGVWVLGLIRSSPADRAGLQQGDELLEIDGQAVGDRSPFQVASQIQGASPSPSSASSASPSIMPPPFVDLKVRKEGGDEHTYRIERPVQTLASPVTARLQEDTGRKVGYIRLASFNSRAQSDVAAAIRDLSREGADEFVLDLRDNRGGLIQEGIEVAKLFLNGPATVVVTEGRGGTAQRQFQASEAAMTQAPLAVLINQYTASASEVLAGALHDNCRAILVGKRTYGKGLIQSVYELSDSSGLVLTVGKYLTPARVDIDLEGLKPDFSRLPAADVAAEHIAACRLPSKA